MAAAIGFALVTVTSPKSEGASMMAEGTAPA